MGCQTQYGKLLLFFIFIFLHIWFTRYYFYWFSIWRRRQFWILKIKIIPKLNEYYSVISVMPKSVGNDTSYVSLANLVQKISLFLVFNMALAAILKNRLLEYFPARFGRCMGAYFSSNRFILSNQSRN